MNEDQNNLWKDKVSSQGTLSTGHLLVPIHLDVLLVGSSVDENYLWKSTQPRYRRLDDSDYQGLGKYLERGAYDPPSSQLLHDPGVHLHWTLPKAYRHGIQNESDGAPVFPKIPNRWLLIRSHLDEHEKLQIKSLIIENDIRSTSGTGGPNHMFLDQTSRDSSLVPGVDNYQVEQIGASKDFDASWVGSNAAPFLTIMSAGDPSFAAVYDSCKGVLGFHDKMENAAPGTYSYQVVGWCSDPEEDLLGSVSTVEEWLAKMEDLSWEVNLSEADQSDILLPKAVLCHAFLHSIKWEGTGTNYENTIPEKINVDIGIGNSADEALAALSIDDVLSGDQHYTDGLLGTLQYKLLADYYSETGLDVLNEQIHKQGFHSSEGGTLWMIEEEEKQNAPDPNSLTDKIPPSPNEYALLRALNMLQEEFDKKTDDLASVQWELYATWFRRRWLYSSDRPDADEILEQTGSTMKEIKDGLKISIANLQAESAILKNRLLELKARKNTIEVSNGDEGSDEESMADYTGLIPNKYQELGIALAPYTQPEYKLSESKKSNFYEANDPTVVFAGIEPSENYTTEGTLLCRLSEQLIFEWNYERTKTPTKVKASKEDLYERIEPNLPQNGNVPSVMYDLYKESLLLDPALTMPVARIAYHNFSQGNPPSDAAVEILAADLATDLNETDITGFLDSDTKPAILPVAHSRTIWAQPWNPIFLEWDVDWYPSFNDLTDADVWKNWLFAQKEENPEYFNNIDFQWQGNPNLGQSLSTFRGRIPLSAHLSGKLQELLHQFPNYTFDEGFLSKFNPISQAFGGFNDQLMMRENSIQLPPLKFNNDEEEFFIDPIIADIDDEYHLSPMPEAKGFFPLRSGHLQIANLRIIDSFSQVFQMENPDLIVAQGMGTQTQNAKTFLELPPRLAQATRLSFKWLAADTQMEGIETDIDPTTSPVCGWLLPNSLDRSLMVFDAQGHACGQLRLIDSLTDESTKVDWEIAPGKMGDSDLEANVSNVSNEQLKEFLKKLIEAEDAYTRLDDLLKHIASVQSRIYGNKTNDQTQLPLPVGKPVALVMADCQLELKGQPAAYQGYDDRETNYLKDLSFTTCFGDARKKSDGLIAYFTENDFDTLYLPFADKKAWQNDYFSTLSPLRLTVDASPSPLTLLVDPSAGLYANCGILPSKFLRLPQQGIDEALDAIQIYFLVTSLLSPKDKLTVPFADIADKQWSWIHPREDSSLSGKTEIPEPGSDSFLTFDKPIEIVEGWLKLHKT